MYSIQHQIRNSVTLVRHRAPHNMVKFTSRKERRREALRLFNTIFSGAEDRRKLGLTQEELFGLFELKCPAGKIDLAA